MRDLPADFSVLNFIEVICAVVENRVMPKPVRLMHLKIKTHRCHKKSPYLLAVP
jgi:hypothetical protein